MEWPYTCTMFARQTSNGRLTLHRPYLQEVVLPTAAIVGLLSQENQLLKKRTESLTRIHSHPQPSPCHTITLSHTPSTSQPHTPSPWLCAGQPSLPPPPPSTSYHSLPHPGLPLPPPPPHTPPTPSPSLHSLTLALCRSTQSS